jgi:hypothetical protein
MALKRSGIRQYAGAVAAATIIAANSVSQIKSRSKFADDWKEIGGKMPYLLDS